MDHPSIGILVRRTRNSLGPRLASASFGRYRSNSKRTLALFVCLFVYFNPMVMAVYLQFLISSTHCWFPSIIVRLPLISQYRGYEYERKDDHAQCIL